MGTKSNRIRHRGRRLLALGDFAVLTLPDFIYSTYNTGARHFTVTLQIGDEDDIRHTIGFFRLEYARIYRQIRLHMLRQL